MAGATGLILSFLAGVMVGRSVDSAAGDVHASKPVQEEQIVAEEPVKPAPSPVEDLTYAQRLESEKTDVTLERPKPAASAASTAVKRPVAKPSAAKTTPPPAKPAPSTAPTAAPAKPAVVKPAAAPSSAPPAAAHGGSFTIQVGAFKDRASADRVI